MEGLDLDRELDFDFGWLQLDGPDPLRVLDALELDRRLAAAADYVHGRIGECDRALALAEEIDSGPQRPPWGWEVDLSRGLRCLDRGDRAGGEALIRRAGTTARGRSPLTHVAVEMVGLLVAEWIYDGETAIGRIAYEATQRVMPRGFVAAFIVLAAALEGDREFAQRELRALLSDGIEPLRRPDSCVPMALVALAYAAVQIGDREAGARLRTLLEPLRGHVVAPLPIVGFGHVAEWHIGRLEMLAGNLDTAVEELRAAALRADECELAWARGHIRVDLATALHRRGDFTAAATALAAGAAIGRRFGVGWTRRAAAAARAELEGREPESTARPKPGLHRLRALVARGGRQALAAMVAGLDDAAIERRFAAPGSQRTLLKAMAQTFQPARANGFRGLVSYELQPFAIEAPADAPWCWTMELDAERGEARLVEPAPQASAVRVEIGLAEWVRVLAGSENALGAMVAGRCRVEGDVVLAVRLEAMFGGA